MRVPGRKRTAKSDAPSLRTTEPRADCTPGRSATRRPQRCVSASRPAQYFQESLTLSPNTTAANRSVVSAMPDADVAAAPMTAVSS